MKKYKYYDYEVMTMGLYENGTTLNQINDFQEKNNIKLPPLYINFLLIYNGGRANSLMFRNEEAYNMNFEIDSGVSLFNQKGYESTILSFFGFTHDNNINTDIEYMFQDYSQCYEYDSNGYEFFPFARDVGSTLYVISIGEKDYGAVFAQYYTAREFDMMRIADSFADFLTKIEPDPFWQSKDPIEVDRKIREKFASDPEKMMKRLKSYKDNCRELSARTYVELSLEIVEKGVDVE